MRSILFPSPQPHALKKRGLSILHVKRVSKRPQAPELVESRIIDEGFLTNWETQQFRTSIPWIPKAIGMRLVEPHQQHNLRTSYFLASAMVSGFLGRPDEKRPNTWFGRLKLPAPSELAADVQEHLASASKIICAKINQDVTTLNTKNLSPWRKAIFSFIVLWKALFSYAGARIIQPAKCTPVLLMASNESMQKAFAYLLSKLWLETQDQFTTRVNRYRGIKSRPKWSVLEELEYDCLGVNHGFALNDPRLDSGKVTASANSVKASSLQDFLEEVIALRFCLDFLSESHRDSEDFMDHCLKRQEKAKRGQKGGKKAPLTGQDAARMALDSYVYSTWSEDAEVRAISKHIQVLMNTLQGRDAHLQAMTCVAQLSLAMWKGLSPMLEASAAKAVSAIDARHIQNCTIPTPMPEHPDDALNTATFHLMARSYEFTDPEKARQILNAAPTAILALVCKLQSNFKGFMLRSRHASRIKTISLFCKDINWPRAADDHEDDDPDEPAVIAKRAAKKRDSNKTLEEKIATYKPVVSQYLGGQGLDQDRKNKELKKPGALSKQDDPSLPRAKGEAVPIETLEDLPMVRITADHRACADLYAVYLFNMYRRREMAKIWKGLSFAYDTVIRNFVDLLDKNASLKPMVESVSAQLKRGKVIGFSKAYVPRGEAAGAQGQGDVVGAPGRIKPVERELFHRKAAEAPVPEEADAQAKKKKKAPWEDDDDAPKTQAPQMGMGAMGADGAAGLGEGEDQLGGIERPPDPNAITLSGDYLTRYLEEHNGDDSNFKDIEPSAIPFSTGTSPRRERPDEWLFREDYYMKKAAETGCEPEDLMPKGGKDGDAPFESIPPPNVTVEWCKSKLKPMWLPIKAHRFTACRSKILQILPQKTVDQYIAYEKNCHYSACIKLLETCIPGNLNVFTPTQLVPNKPLLVETVFQLLVGYVGLCLKNADAGAATRLCLQTLEAMQIALKDLHPAHRAVLEAYLFDTGLSVAFYNAQDLQLAAKAESFFQQASARYLQLKHVNRFAKCCIRYSAVLFSQNHHHEAEYFLQQSLNKLSSAPISSLLVVSYHNLCIETAIQDRLADAGSHMRTYISLLRQMSRLSNQWIQKADNTQWLVLKLQDLWPAYQARLNAGMV